jgi:methylenetetrahydrofolate dehydrogenase (NADP+)/methenyltetrahydrofolate cyclohydrolase
MKYLDGKNIADGIKRKLSALIYENGITPRLDVILASSDLASKNYVALKKKFGDDIGVDVVIHRYEKTVTSYEIEEDISSLVGNDAVDGIMVQLPLYKHLNRKEILSKISVDKDVDGLNPVSLGRAFAGDDNVFLSATARGIVTMLDEYGIDVHGKVIVLVGWNPFIGMPLEAVLSARGATFIVTHEHTDPLCKYTLLGDIVISAVGKENLITGRCVKNGSVLIDVGFVKNKEGKFVGDIDVSSLNDIPYAISPVPGGVGPMTVASLFQNVYTSAVRKRVK